MNEVKLILAHEVISDNENIRKYLKGAIDSCEDDNFYKVLIKIENALFAMKCKASTKDNKNV